MAKLRTLMEGNKEAWNDIEFSEAVKVAEEVIQQGLQQYPDAPYLMVAESELGDLLADDTGQKKLFSWLSNGIQAIPLSLAD